METWVRAGRMKRNALWWGQAWSGLDRGTHSYPALPCWDLARTKRQEHQERQGRAGPHSVTSPCPFHSLPSSQPTESSCSLSLRQQNTAGDQLSGIMMWQVRANTDTAAGSVSQACLCVRSSLTPAGLRAVTMVICSMAMLHPAKPSEQVTVMVPGSSISIYISASQPCTVLLAVKAMGLFLELPVWR